MEFRALRPEELEAWAEHCGEVFAGSGLTVNGDYFLGHFTHDPWKDLGGIFVAADSGRIASTVRVFRRSVWLFGEEVSAGGVGEVSTKPAYRGMGLAGRLLGMAADWMAREGMAVSMLYASLHDFYRQFGWECVPKPFKRFESPCASPCGGRKLTEGDMPALMAVEDEAEKANWRIIRKGAEYWNRWMAREIKDGFAALEAGCIVAWMACAAHGDTWSVKEFRAFPSYEDRFYGLCALAADEMGVRGQPYFAPARFDTRGESAEVSEQMSAMVRLISPLRAGGREFTATDALIEAAGDYADSELDRF